MLLRRLKAIHDERAKSKLPPEEVAKLLERDAAIERRSAKLPENQDDMRPEHTVIHKEAELIAEEYERAARLVRADEPEVELVLKDRKNKPLFVASPMDSRLDTSDKGR